MRKVGFLGLLAAALMATACGAGGAKEASAPPGYAGGQAAPGAPEPASAEYSAGGYGEGASADSAPAPASASGAYEERRAEPAKERPGLGTEWGENRESRVSTAAFFRENPDRPFDVVKMFYNDSDGVRAMAKRAGISDFRDGSGLASRGAVTVRLLDSSGRGLEGFRTAGNTYVIGEHGQRYIIELKNNTGVRFEAVATVDGLDVVNGQTGSFSNRGYILNPWSTVQIDGWRRSTDTVAAFRFGRVSESYASKKGADRNVGVIGVALFEERGAVFPWTRQEIDKRHNADPFPGQFANPPPEAIVQ